MNLFDRSGLKIKLLKERKSNMGISCIKQLSEHITNPGAGIREVAKSIVKAKEEGSAVILMMGAHVLRSGAQNYLVDLMKKGYITCIAMNGAGIIHDYELALTGETTESVAGYIKTGEFGLWGETGRLNDIINAGYKKDKNSCLGEEVGRAIENSDFPYKDISIFAAAWSLGISATVHVGIGYDIIHQHPNCNGAATGALSYNDFLRFASVVQNLENGVVMNFGSAVMAPEVFLKALSMARNVALQKGKTIKHFTTLVCDLRKLPEDYRKEPPESDTEYYFRPWKTMLVRTVADEGTSFYVRGRHSETIPALWLAINDLREENVENP